MKNIVFSLTLLISTTSVFGWGGAGHMTAGAVAYYYLQANNPEVLSKVLKTAANHPWYNSAWKRDAAGLPADEKDIAVFMLMSTYPDSIKRSPELNVPQQHDWHFVDIPYYPNTRDASSVPPLPNAEQKLDSFFQILPNKTESQSKAIDLCWIFHLMEDIHQPLHCATMITSAHDAPKGDLGGNLEFVKTGRIDNLHAYWDDLPTGTIATIPAIANTLFKDPNFAESQLSELNDTSLHDWIYNESYNFAVINAYAQGTINGTRAQPAILSASYQSDAHEIAKKRIVLAGIRLAKKLIELYS